VSSDGFEAEWFYCLRTDGDGVYYVDFGDRELEPAKEVDCEIITRTTTSTNVGENRIDSQ